MPQKKRKVKCATGATRGAAIGHVSPEAAEGGPIGLLQDGDIIRIDMPNRKIEVELSDAELAKRKAVWKPRQQHLTGYLARYARLVTSANKGATVE